MGYIRESAPMAREFYPEHTARLPIPDNEKAEGEGVMNIFRRGCFYNVYGNDALLLNKHFGYNITLSVTDIECTGFNLKCRDAVFERLVDLQINYDVYDQSGRVVTSSRFENNRYEIPCDHRASLKIPRWRRKLNLCPSKNRMTPGRGVTCRKVRLCFFMIANERNSWYNKIYKTFT